MHEDHILHTHSRAHRVGGRLTALGAAVVVGIAGTLSIVVSAAVSGPAGAQVPPRASTSAGTSASTAGKPPVFAYYYLWWSASHWKSALGSN
jgi:nitrous oxide reductase